jgi:hypothetical protein
MLKNFKNAINEALKSENIDFIETKLMSLSYYLDELKLWIKDIREKDKNGIVEKVTLFALKYIYEKRFKKSSLLYELLLNRFNNLNLK